jgi:hypothetical protein
VLIFLGLAYVNGINYIWGAVISYIIMIIECGCSKTSDFVKNVEAFSKTNEIINKLKATPPFVDFKI